MILSFWRGATEWSPTVSLSLVEDEMIGLEGTREGRKKEHLSVVKERKNAGEHCEL